MRWLRGVRIGRVGALWVAVAALVMASAVVGSSLRAAHPQWDGRAAGPARSHMPLGPAGRDASALPHRVSRRAATVGSAEAEWVPASYRGTIIRNRTRYFPDKLLALTFDDGPDPEVTPRILRTLAEHRAHATFLVVGRLAHRHPDLLRAISEGGNAIGNHTYTHTFRATGAAAEREILATNEAIQDAGIAPARLFRPPTGRTHCEVTRLALREGYTVVLWTISSADTRPISPEVIARNVIHTPNPGDIVIMHDGPGHLRTVEALPQILDALGRAGFRFVTVPELLQAWSTWAAARAHRHPGKPWRLVSADERR